MRELLKPELEAKRIEVVNLKFINLLRLSTDPRLPRFSQTHPLHNPSRGFHLHPPGLNNLLYTLLVTPARWRWFRLPFGVSIFGVFIKK